MYIVCICTVYSIFITLAIINYIRSEKHLKNLKKQEKAFRRKEAEWRDHLKNSYHLDLCMEKWVEDHIQLVQAQTQVDSPEEVVFEALILYFHFVDQYSHGYRAVLQKSRRTVLIKYPSLDRVKMKVDA